MQVIVKELEYSRPDKFFLYPLGDIHCGVIHCDEDLLAKKVKEIKNTPNAYIIGMGDYADLITPSDFKRWEGRILPEWMRSEIDNIGPAQLDRVDKLLSPVYDKFLTVIEGNHDDAIRKYTHYDFIKNFLKEMNKNRKVEVPYGGVSCFLVLKFKRKNSSETHEYVIHARHGEGGARTSGARALAVLRLSQSMVNAHITLMGHLHGQESPDIPQRLLYKEGKIRAFEAIATMTGAWLKAYMQDVPPCYLERWGTPPSKLGCPRIVIEPDKGIITLEKESIC